MRAIYVIECDVPDSAATAAPITAIGDAQIPYFTGRLLMTLDPKVSQILQWLDEKDPQ